MARGDNSKRLRDALAEVLPEGIPFTFYHYSTPPIKSPALFNAPPHCKPERTYCESHILGTSVAPKDQTASGDPHELLILAIEVFIYSTKNLTTIFVSKADSTGHITALNLPRAQSGSPLKSICGTFVSWLARERQREGKKLVVSLFARAQDQYLFPASIDNPDKHVLDDRGLIKWWCKVLDPLVREYAVEEDKKSFADRLADGTSGGGRDRYSTPRNDYTAKGYLVIPGIDQYDTLRYTPPPPSPSASRRWVATHPLHQIAPRAGAPPRCLVPHFPDDPKSRFLDELDEELPDARTYEMCQQGGTPSRSNGQWRSVKTLDQFWEMMGFRQECSSGRVTGFIWVVITPPRPSISEEEEGSEPASQSHSQNVNDSQDSAALSVSSPKKAPRRFRRSKVNTDSGPIPLILPRIKSSTSNQSSASVGSNSAGKLPPENTPYYTWPSTSRGTLLLSTTAYARANEVMLQQNFATRTAAARSTKRWKDEIAVLGGVEKWEWTVIGKKKTQPSATSATTNGATPVTIMGVRKKRKPEPAHPESNGKGEDGIQTLDGGLVKKKAKLEDPAAGTSPGAANGVNTLGAGLVRKKPKQ
jgi:regulator of Ty1 transposition protein 109